jgi:DNA replication protein DnaC
MTPAGGELDALLKRLNLANTRRIWPQLVERAEKEEWSYRDFLGLLVAEEIAHRQQTRLARLSRRARFPFLKTSVHRAFNSRARPPRGVAGAMGA